MEEKFEHDSVMEITQRIAELRDACGYTQEDFARELGIDPETYQAYERNASAIPVSLICNIANLCGVELSEIMTGVSAKLHTLQIVKKGEARGMRRYPGYRLEDLAHRFANKTMQPIMVTILPDDPPAPLVSHGGQEFNYILEGSIELQWGEKSYVLEAGDSVYFDPAHEHGQRCFGGKRARFLTIIAE